MWRTTVNGIWLLYCINKYLKKQESEISHKKISESYHTMWKLQWFNCSRIIIEGKNNLKLSIANETSCFEFVFCQLDYRWVVVSGASEYGDVHPVYYVSVQDFSGCQASFCNFHPFSVSSKLQKTVYFRHSYLYL